METAKQYLEKKGIKPKISFKDGQEHFLTILNCKEDTIVDQQGKETTGLKFLVIEDKILKTFFTTSIALISKLADLPEKTKVAVKQIKYSTQAGIRTTYDVAVVGKTMEEKSQDIPVVEDNSPKAGDSPEGDYIEN